MSFKNRSIRRDNPATLTALFIGVWLAIHSTIGLRADEPKAPAAWTPANLIKVNQIGSVQVSPDGKQVAFTVRQAVMDGDKSEYLTHIHLVRADGSQETQLTRGGKSCDDPQWSPDGKWIAFVSSRSGKKNLWLIEPSGGEAQQVSDVKSGVGSFRWAPDGKAIAFTALDPPTPEEEKAVKQKNDARIVDHNIKMHRLYLIQVTAPPKLQREPKLLTKGEFSINNAGSRAGRAAFDWSPDGRTIVFSHTRTPQADDWSSADLSLVDVATGAIRVLANTAAVESSPFYSPDGKSIAYVASDDPPTWAGHARILVVAATGGSPRALAETKDGFGRYSELIGWSGDATKLYFTEIHGTILRLLSMALDGTPVEMSPDAGMSFSGVFLNASRTHFGYAWESLDRPSGAFVGSVDSFDPKQISRPQQGLPTATLGRTEVVRYHVGRKVSEVVQVSVR